MEVERFYESNNDDHNDKKRKTEENWFKNTKRIIAIKNNDQQH